MEKIKTLLSRAWAGACFLKAAASLFFVAGMGILAVPARMDAAGLRVQDVCPDAMWAVTVDFGATFGGDAGRSLLNGLLKKREAQVAAFEAGTGFKFALHLDSVTLSGTGRAGSGAIVLRHHFQDVGKLEKWLASRKGVTRVTRNGIESSGDRRYRLSANGISGEGVPGNLPFSWAKPVFVEFGDASGMNVVLIAAEPEELDAAWLRLNSLRHPPISLPLYHDMRQDGKGHALASGFARVEKLMAKRPESLMKNPAVPHLSRVQDVAFQVLAPKAGMLRFDFRGVFKDASTAAAMASMVESFFIAQAPQFPFLRDATVEPRDATLRIVADVSVEQLLALFSSK
ncbi:MAG: hypothetical protein LBG65_08440 [Puniceicoccales bacterium]|jgi:hypothetical protein|nr:hypothetical protein [Puniceicoccales bacterium]